MTGEQDDKQIVTAVLCGDTAAFDVLVRRYWKPLRRLAISRTGRLDEAEDIVQETFISAYKSLHTYQSAYNFRTWLWTILINQCRRHGTKAARLPDQLDRPDESGHLVSHGSAAPSPDARMQSEEQERYLQGLLSQLPETRADAVRLRFMGELKYREIADALDCSLSAAKKWVREGLLAMGETLRATDSMAGNVDSTSLLHDSRETEQ